jgi:hypothetical protein
MDIANQDPRRVYSEVHHGGCVLAGEGVEHGADAGIDALGR